MWQRWCWVLFFFLFACDGQPWNDPYPGETRDGNTYYSSFNERPRTFDPAKSFSSNEYQFISQIYEPPLQYNYFLRPYVLIPLLAEQMPAHEYLNAEFVPLSEEATHDQIAYTLYTITIKPNIHYQPHPALAKDELHDYLYHNLTEDYIEHNRINTLADFDKTGSREVMAEDFVYQIKRLAHPNIQSPILGLMSEHIVGLAEYAKTLQQAQAALGAGQRLDVRDYPLSGVKVVDRYTYQILIKQKYPQFIYWLAMPFFAPVPWEADTFTAQPGMAENNITLDWYPIGTGPYYLTQNNPNRKMVLVKNPNFRMELFPYDPQIEGEQPSAGERMPFMDSAVFILERESIPRWNKFLQGYYDMSGVTSDSFDQAIQYDIQGKAQLADDMRTQGIHLITEIEPSVFYWGFNMLDEVVGGYDEQSIKLRQAINIALNQKEFIDIFLNGRGTVAQGPIPPGIFGYQPEQSNPYLYTEKNGRVIRKSIDDARRLMQEAGFPAGRDEKTHRPLILNFDAVGSGGPDDQARFAWLRKQFALLGIQLNIRATQYNRFQEKLRNGQAQLFFAGWHADYPDPENFLFLFYGPNSKVLHDGENAVNYHNEQYDKLFEQMEDMADDENRQVIIDQMIALLQQDTPWAWGFYPVTLTLSHQWLTQNKPLAFSSNTLKYYKLDPQLRAEKRKRWNQPMWWPLLALLGIIIILCIPVFMSYWKKIHRKP